MVVTIREGQRRRSERTAERKKGSGRLGVRFQDTQILMTIEKQDSDDIPFTMIYNWMKGSTNGGRVKDGQTLK